MDQVVNSGNFTEVPVPRWVFDVFIEIQEQMGPYSMSVNEMIQRIIDETTSDGVYMGALSVVNPNYEKGSKVTKLVKIQKEIASELRSIQNDFREISGLNLRFEDVVANAIIFALAEVNGVDGIDLFRWFTREISKLPYSRLFCVSSAEREPIVVQVGKGKSKDFSSFEWRI